MISIVLEPNIMNTKKIISILLLVIAVTLQLQVFIHQFHQTADDNVLQFISFKSDWTYVFKFAHDTAKQHGRIGQYGNILLNSFSSYFIDYHIFRLFILIIFVMFYAACFLYFDLLLETKTYWITITIAIASIPLTGYHFPPQ